VEGLMMLLERWEVLSKDREEEKETSLPFFNPGKLIKTYSLLSLSPH
jgi:hypothetical protein